MNQQNSAKKSPLQNYIENTINTIQNKTTKNDISNGFIITMM